MLNPYLFKRFLLYCLVLFACGSFAQDRMDFESYNPKSTLVVKEHLIKRAKYPFIDVHNHQWDMPNQNLEGLLNDMDGLNMVAMVNLSGRGGKMISNYHGTSLFTVNGPDYFDRTMANVKKNGKGRILVFTNIDFTNIDDPNWTKNTMAQLEEDVKNGASGLKVYKELGLEIKDKNGKRIPVDDPRIDPVWEKCGELHIPVLIHTGEPAPFFDKPDANNERWLELKLHPSRARPSSRYPSWKQVMSEQHHIFAKHRNTTFIAAHFGWLANNLQALGTLLDTLPNVYTEFAAVMEEIGREPKTARAFFIKYQDRILFGKDTWSVPEYGFYFRMLETDDEYFPPLRRYHAFWNMYGLGLPDDVLKKVYYKNALKLFPQIDRSLFPQ
ncbi:amidohydrolase family protein [Mucilaginibacter ginsenosidivorans]|uniref:Amidohydrolase n=1 Tax=Mucilaginibacter ginsenosidivorans TaxID=398053 RepID=A0A5B8V3L1_9SPHI|nr:amidohydrolase family protein [Mucilaginibacter ginsenosidivorans]QEC65403.1 amidohydrolase [Mucilaginibacter ginsenosidivorans]